ncbi:COP23 domain-containing protein [Oscillatoria acuminata]|uniref:Uncharacterized protein n=1 Tax=Oscillatoria acuminata PCC 6304 TaxID=56110 RepID=K9TEY9_9CYAN|nr:COP23 domain-containing protein [Oscillatoria acuminata]AFY81427.1 hypothetical protein Oscil6304_1746 [Oscillatoria acuminata PCC 6304]
MKSWKCIGGMVTAGAIALGAAFTFTEPGQAQANCFICQADNNNVPTTYAQTGRGNVAVIKWASTHFSGSGYTPMTRCQEVSERFNQYNAQGQLEYLSSGRQNSQPVVCAGSSCTGNNLLFTLRPNQNAAQVLQELFASRSGAGGPSHQAVGGSEVFTVDMNEYLRTAPVENTSSSPSGDGGSSSGGSVW